MLLCMRTTLDINDELLRRAKTYATEHGQSLKAVVEDALRERLRRRTAMGPRPPSRVPTFSGRGLQPGVDLTDNASVLDLMDDAES